MNDFKDRQRWDLDAWPEMYGTLKELQALVFLSPPGIETNMMVFTVASLTAGCRHCQAHGAPLQRFVGHGDRRGVERLGGRTPRSAGLGHRQARRSGRRATQGTSRQLTTSLSGIIV